MTVAELIAKLSELPDASLEVEVEFPEGTGGDWCFAPVRRVVVDDILPYSPKVTLELE